MENAESAMAASLSHETHDIIAISWERIATETASDPTMRLLLDTIQEGFPDDRRAANDDIAAFWTYRDSLNVTDGVILYRDRVVVPPSLRDNWSFESSISQTREYHPWSHEPDLSYSGRVRPMTYGLSENTALPVTGQHRYKQPRPPSHRQSLQPRSNKYSQTFFYFGGCHHLVAGDRYPDGSRYAKLLMGEDKPVPRA